MTKRIGISGPTRCFSITPRNPAHRSLGQRSGVRAPWVLLPHWLHWLHWLHRLHRRPPCSDDRVACVQSCVEWTGLDILRENLAESVNHSCGVHSLKCILNLPPITFSTWDTRSLTSSRSADVAASLPLPPVTTYSTHCLCR